MVSIRRDYPLQSELKVFVNGVDVSDICTRFDDVEGWAIVDGKRVSGKVDAYKSRVCETCHTQPSAIEYLITGTGHSGTEWAAQVLTSVGVNCGHETFFDNSGFDVAMRRLNERRGYKAESSWLSAPYINNEYFNNTRKIHLVRHPVAVISSWLVQVSACLFDGSNVPFANSYTKFTQYAQPIDRAVARYISWNLLNEGHAQLVKIEDGAQNLLDVCGIGKENKYHNQSYNAHNTSGQKYDISQASPELLVQLEAMMERYGYE